MILRMFRRNARRWITSFAAIQVVVMVLYYSSSTRQTSLAGQQGEEESNELDSDQASDPLVLNSGYPEFNPKRVLTLTDDIQPHFQRVGKAEMCYVAGTNVEKTLELKSEECQCREGYYGRECGIPASVWYRTVEQRYHRWKLTPRKVPRRIIHGLNINHELDFFRVRLEELQDAVDAYIVCESNYTANGNAKPLYLLDQLKSGFMAAFHQRIVYVKLDKFPSKGHSDGWFVDKYLRTYMGTKGLKRIKVIRPDDLFVLLDADEIPTKEVLMFLKLYDGYPEPVQLALRWSVFGFFWKRKKNTTSNGSSIFNWVLKVMKEGREYEEDLLEVTAVATMSMVWEVCQNDTFLIRKDMTGYADFQERLRQYRTSQPGRLVNQWAAGTREHYAGHHCSWCYSAEGIRTKLLSAHLDDKPRWGDYPEKLDLDYINKLIRSGEWFDGSHPLLVADWEKEDQYAPRYILDHEQEFRNLLYPPDVAKSLSRK